MMVAPYRVSPITGWRSGDPKPELQKVGLSGGGAISLFGLKGVWTTGNTSL